MTLCILFLCDFDFLHTDGQNLVAKKSAVQNFYKYFQAGPSVTCLQCTVYCMSLFIMDIWDNLMAENWMPG